MSLVRLENVTKIYSGEAVLDGISFRVENGERIGLIGRNGTGKSTVFRLITGEVVPESGLIERMRKARIACLSQIPHVNAHDTIFDAVMHAFCGLIALEQELGRLEAQLGAHDAALLKRYSALQDEFVAKGGYTFRTTVKQVLHGLGFTMDEFGLRVGALSGGQMTRLRLALVLLEDADLLLLDEPENHLDVRAREWLENFLSAWPRAFVIISHDRQMLNTLVRRIVEVEYGRLIEYAGNYDAYLEQKTFQREQQQRAFDRQQEIIRREESWIDRFRYKATKARQVQSRIKRLDKLERVEAPPPEGKTARFRLGEVVRSGQLVLEAKNLTMQYGDLVLYRDFSLRVERGQRVGIVGPNGSGKTTLLRHIAGQLENATGEVQLGHKVVLAVYDQQHENLNRSGDMLGEIRAVRPDMETEQVRSFMGRFLFTGEDVFKPISTLSGGELSRVAMAKLILSEANVLLLDEPTNHLDIASREALEQSLASFPGTILCVSHDRALIDRLVDSLIIVENGNASVHLGNYSDYRWRTEQENEAVLIARSVTQDRTEDVLRIRAKKFDPKNKEMDKARRKREKQIEELEHNIESIEALIESCEERFVSLDPADYLAAQTLKQEYDALKRDLQEMYEEWERLAENKR